MEREEIRIVIVATGRQSDGKTRAIDAAIAGLAKHFQILSQMPKVEGQSSELYTFTARLRD